MTTFKKILVVLSLSALSTAFAAEPAISHVQVRQRWPWSPKVDIDFITSGANCFVEFSATWKGQSDPVPLSAGLSGVNEIFRPGLHSVVWDPVAAGYGEQTLEGFKIASAVALETSRTWMILDLVNNTCSYKDGSVDASTFNTDTYKKTKIVLRRVPAGTYTAGLSSELKSWKWPDGVALKTPYVSSCRITFSSDYYISIFKVTAKQQSSCTGSTAYSEKYPTRYPFETVRGYHTNRFNSAGMVSNIRANWPDDGFSVGKNSHVWMIREKFKSTLPEGFVIDLPTAMQWEIAARAGVADCIWDVGDTTWTAAQMTNHLDTIAVWNKGGADNYAVGTKAPNAWGIYDTTGLYREHVLDWAAWTSPYETSTDPVGSAEPFLSNKVYRRYTRCNGTALGPALCQMAPSALFTDYSVSASKAAYRIVVNTKNWTGKPIVTEVPSVPAE